MHELGLVQEIIEVAEARAAGAKVTRVRVEVGTEAVVLPDAMRFAFEVASAGTTVEGAALELVDVPGNALRITQLEVV